MFNFVHRDRLCEIVNFMCLQLLWMNEKIFRGNGSNKQNFEIFIYMLNNLFLCIHPIANVIFETQNFVSSSLILTLVDTLKYIVFESLSFSHWILNFCFQNNCFVCVGEIYGCH